MRFRCGSSSSHSGRLTARLANLACTLYLQAVLASGQSLHCDLPQELQSQLLFKGSGFFIVATTLAATTESSQLKSSATQTAAPSNDVKSGYVVAYVLADDDPPELARHGLWYSQLTSCL